MSESIWLVRTAKAIPHRERDMDSGEIAQHAGQPGGTTDSGEGPVGAGAARQVAGAGADLAISGDGRPQWAVRFSLTMHALNPGVQIALGWLTRILMLIGMVVAAWRVPEAVSWLG